MRVLARNQMGEGRGREVTNAVLSGEFVEVSFTFY